MSIEVHKISLGKEKLSLMSSEDRAAYILCGHLFNEINLYGKLLLWSRPSGIVDDLHIKACLTQYVSLVKTFSGKLYEAWEAVGSLYLRTSLSKRYQSLLEQDELDALDQLKKYFGKKNIIGTIRNKFAFHYDAKFISEAYESCPEYEDWSMYLSIVNANSLYYFSEAAINHKMLIELEPTDLQLAMNNVHIEFTQVWRHLIRFLSGLMIAIGRENGINAYEDANASSIFVEVSDCGENILPFYREKYE